MRPRRARARGPTLTPRSARRALLLALLLAAPATPRAAHAFTPEAAAVVARGAWTTLTGVPLNASLGATLDAAIEARVAADAADPEGALVRHRFDVAAADSTPGLTADAPQTAVTGGASFEFAAATMGLRVAMSGGDAVALQAALARAAVAACDLADPFLTTAPAADDGAAASAAFSEQADATMLAGAPPTASAASSGDPLADAVILARASAALRPAVETAVSTGDAAALSALRVGRVNDALALLRSVIVRGAGVTGRPTVAMAAWPNPTAGPLTLRFALPSTAAVRLEVVDVTGRLRIDRDLGSRPAGSQSLELGAAMRTLAPGTYFVRVHAPDFSATARVVRLAP